MPVLETFSRPGPHSARNEVVAKHEKHDLQNTPSTVVGGTHRVSCFVDRYAWHQHIASGVLPPNCTQKLCRTGRSTSNIDMVAAWWQSRKCIQFGAEQYH